MNDDPEKLNVPDETNEPDFGQPVQSDNDRFPLDRGQSGSTQSGQEKPDAPKENGGAAKDQLQKMAADKIRVAAAQAIRSATVAAWGWISATLGPYAGIIVVALILILICASPAFGLYNKAAKGAWGNGNATYASFNDPADSTMLREFFSNIKGGDPAKLKSTAMAIKDKVAQGKLQFKDNAKATQLLDDMIQLCDAALSAGGALDQDKMMELRAELIDLFDMDNPIALQGRFAHPFGQKKITRFNGTLHGKSAQRTEDDSGHNVFNGISQPGSGDATDMSQEEGIPLFAMFDGHTSLPESRVEKPRDHCIVLKSTNYSNKIEAWYCHVGNKLVDKDVTAGTQIATLGKSGISHLHLEVWVDGKSIHTTAADLASNRYSSEPGKYLWEHIKLAFNINDIP